MKKIYVQKQCIGWEEFTYEVPDDFNDYKSLIDSTEWVDWEYLVESSEHTGKCEICDENYNVIKTYD